MKHHRVACAALAIAAGLSVSLSTIAEGQVRWRTGEAELTVEALPNAGLVRQIEHLAADPNRSRIVVQFDRPLSDAEREAVAANGMTLHGYLGDYAYFAGLDRARTNARALAGIGQMRAIGEIRTEWKLHPLLLDGDAPAHAIVGSVGGVDLEVEPLVAVNVLFHRDADADAWLDDNAPVRNLGVISRYMTANGATIELPLSEILAMAEADEVKWIEPVLPPLTELNDQNRELTGANIAQEPPFSLDGTGISAFIFDGGRASNHTDFGNRHTQMGSANISGHATHVAGTVGGDGSASNGQNRGMAPNVTLVSAGFQWGSGGIFLYTNPGNFETSYETAINNHNVDIANNSIGTNTATNGFPCDITGEYGVTDVIIDSIVRGSMGDPFRIVFANGNERQSQRCGNLYNTTAPPACAKNHMTVGAVNSDDDSMTSFSSWGPANDGRMKPDIVAPGCRIGSGGVVSTSGTSNYSSACGTSMAAPTATGLAALLMQEFREMYPEEPLPRNSTLRAIFAHTAKDLENEGPDYMTGFGSARIIPAVELLREEGFGEEEILQGDTVTINIPVLPDDEEVRFTIAWDDPAGVPNSIPALVNDVDVRLISPSGTIHYPWTLDPNNPSAPAVQDKHDRVNNIEQVFVGNPEPGSWRAEIIGYNIPEGPQVVSFAGTPTPDVARLFITPVEAFPTEIAPGEPYEAEMQVGVGGQELVGLPKLHFRTDSQSNYTTFELTEVGDDIYTVTLPTLSCGDEPEFYFSVEGNETGVVYYPSQGAAAPKTTLVGAYTPLYIQNFDDPGDWTAGVPGDDATTGHWEWGNPIGTSWNGIQIQPANCQTGFFCYFTGQHTPGQGPGYNDVDHGKTTLLSSTMDLSPYAEARISYYRWYSNDVGANPNSDIFEVDISNDGGETWTSVEVVGPDGPGTSGGWIKHEFLVSELVNITDNMVVRFIASDEDPQALVEAAIDAFEVHVVACESTCVADWNGDGEVDINDFFAYLSDFEDGNMRADLNNDGEIDINDFFIFLDLFEQGC